MDETQVMGGLALSVQLGTAIYALRLNRLFGSQRAGWSLFGAFALMLAVHISEASKTWDHSDPASEWMSQLVYLVSSTLLAIGLAHVGLIFRARLAAEQAVHAGRELLEERVRKRTAELAKANASLQTEIHERQRAEAEKLQCISRLAGGVAHDFNNILTIVQGQTAYALTLEDLPPPARQCLAEVQSAAERAAQVTGQLLAVARGQTVQRELVDLNALIRKKVQKLHRSLGEGTRVQLELPSTPITVKADAGMLRQMLASLLANARQAMPNGGQLKLTTRLVALQAHQQDGRTSPKGSYAELTVSDSGPAIDPELLPRIFEPFCNPKDVAEGSGLGLATAQGVARQHQGWIDVTSAPGQGTTFVIYLPATTEPGAEVARPESIELEKPDDARVPTLPAQGMVLLVEDDASIRRLASRLLSRSGFTVLEADSGVAALTLWEKHRDSITLLFTDIVMPQGVNGWDLARRLRVDRPGLRVLCTSGYVPEGIEGDAHIRLLAKPYDGGQLIEAIQSVLAE
jgi:signal transduction histidine kinase/CheY-like chemotaxis protein